MKKLPADGEEMFDFNLSKYIYWSSLRLIKSMGDMKKKNEIPICHFKR